MRDQPLKAKIRELDRFYAECCQPFPSDDCRRLLASRLGSRRRYRDLISDLDLYDSWVSGNCSWSSKILGWSPDRMHKILKISSASFFMWFPQYKPLKLQITKRCYPALYTKLKHLAKMRQVLAEVLTYLLSQPDMSQFEVAVPEKKSPNSLQTPPLNRKMRLVHRQARMAYHHRDQTKHPVKFPSPALRFIRVQPLGESIF